LENFKILIVLNFLDCEILFKTIKKINLKSNILIKKKSVIIYISFTKNVILPITDNVIRDMIFYLRNQNIKVEL